MVLVKPWYIPGYFISHISHQICNVSIFGMPHEVKIEDVILVKVPQYEDKHKLMDFEFYDPDQNDWIYCQLNKIDQEEKKIEIR